MTVPRCRSCGCTDRNACVNLLLTTTCSWAAVDLCTGCAPDAVPGWQHPVARVPHRPPSGVAAMAPDLLGTFAIAGER